MKLTEEQVRHVAKLANLPLSDKEEKLYSEQLSKILDYIDQLNQVDTSGVEATFNVSAPIKSGSGLENVMRVDEPVASLTQEEALQNAPQKENSFFVTKRVIGEDRSGS